MYTKTELLLMLKDLEAHEPQSRFCAPQDIFTRMAEYRELEQEHFFVIGLNGKHEEVYIEMVSKGILDRTLTHPREIFRRAIKENLIAIVLCHNHPSENPEPSIEDKGVTKRLVNAGEIIGIPVLDHIIIAKTGYYSFLEDNAL